MLGTTLYVLQEKLMFFPTTLTRDFTYNFQYPFEELFLEPENDVLINAVHFKNENPKGVILYFHGNAGDLSRWGTITEYFVEKNYDVLVMDYRTYGKSKGKLSEQGFYDDAQFCYNYLKSRYDESDIILYGRSLGTGVANYLASKNQPKQLILETPYYSITDIAKHRFPFFPVKSLIKYEFNSFEYIQNVKCPITIIHGTHDQVVPYSSGNKLFDIAPKSITKMKTIDGGRHNDLVNFDAYHEVIASILN
ncbi:alpha/beta hydrolase [Psychroserpens sp.]|uniref:alpha/beta hydrolase n=2 Tax=Psychroserpens sp. TaxID=2020870 RepID=UPI002AA6D9BE|nr:alpha/beta hydrolase [Psychroserpens sp.]